MRSLGEVEKIREELDNEVKKLMASREQVSSNGNKMEEFALENRIHFMLGMLTGVQFILDPTMDNPMNIHNVATEIAMKLAKTKALIEEVTGRELPEIEGPDGLKKLIKAMLDETEKAGKATPKELKKMREDLENLLGGEEGEGIGKAFQEMLKKKNAETDSNSMPDLKSLVEKRQERNKQKILDRQKEKDQLEIEERMVNTPLYKKLLKNLNIK